MMVRFPANYLTQGGNELDLALSSVPAYQAWRAVDDSRQAIDARYAALPLLTKADLRQWGFAGFLAPGLSLEQALAAREVEVVHTSGTTAEQVDLLWHQAWWDASERASWQLNSHARAAGLDHHPEAILTSPLSTGVHGRGATVDLAARRLARFLYLNEFPDSRDWTDDHIRRMCDEMDAFQPVVLEANPSFLARFARRLAALGRRCHQPRLIVLTYEMPSRLHRRQIARAFSCPLVSSHGCTEAGYVFMECEAGAMHQNAACVRVDTQRMKHDGQLARLAVTSFGNPWRVLLRFDMGDIIRPRSLSVPCPCGRHEGLVVEGLEGRVQDLTFDSRGLPVTVGSLDRGMDTVPHLLEYQVVQTGPRDYAVAMLAERHQDMAADAVRHVLGDLYGSRRIGVRHVLAIAPSPSGKHRLAWSEAPFDVAALFEGPMGAG